MYACAGTFSVAKACMAVPKHRRFIACEFDPSFKKESLPKVVVLFARQMLSRESGLMCKKMIVVLPS